MDEKNKLIEQRLRGLAWADDDSDWGEVVRRAGSSWSPALSSQEREQRGCVKSRPSVRRKLPVRRDRRVLRLRPRVLAGTTVGAAGTAVVLALVLSAAGSSPAFAVTRNRDGSYSVTLRALSALPAANAKLARMGVPARLVQVPANCTNTIAALGAGAGQNVIVPAHARTVIAAWHNTRAESVQIAPVTVPVPGGPGSGNSVSSGNSANGGSGNSGNGAVSSITTTVQWNQVCPAASPTGAGNSGNSSNNGAGNSGNS
jgi:hypothetical protein